MGRLEEKKHNVQNANGFGNWTIVLLSFIAVIVILDNYQKYDFITHPIEVVKFVINTFISNFPVYGILGYSIVQQTLHMYLIEKLISLRIVSDKLGLTLHAVNAFFSAYFFVMVSRSYSLNFGVVRGISPFVFNKIPKVWSYAYVNYVFRQQSNKDHKYGSQPITYPKNVTLRNAFTYILFTPEVQYQPSGFQRTASNWKSWIKKIFYAFLLFCLLTFIVIQYVTPEIQAIKYTKWSFVPTTKSLILLLVYIHIIWLGAYLISYKLYHSAYADLMGMPHIKFDADWWNSTHLTDFWRRWNFVVHDGLKNTVVKPLYLRGWNANAIQLVAFTIAGVFHEILYTLPFKTLAGGPMITTLLEIPCGKVSKYVAEKYGKEYGNILLWLYLLTTHSVSILSLACIYNIPGLP